MPGLVDFNVEQIDAVSVSGPPQVAERATELFFTTKNADKGTGMGLFLALDFVDKAGGRLLIESQPGAGTRVRLLFPYHRLDRHQPRGTRPSSG